VSLKHLFGLDDLRLSDAEIMARIKSAFDRDLNEVEFVKKDGTKVVIKLPYIDFTAYADPWDGQVLGRGAS
jgi:hypothetical protein